jgi:hypothetical protein
MKYIDIKTIQIPYNLMYKVDDEPCVVFTDLQGSLKIPVTLKKTITIMLFNLVYSARVQFDGKHYDNQTKLGNNNYLLIEVSYEAQKSKRQNTCTMCSNSAVIHTI